MDGTLKWIASGVVGAIGVFGLFLAANAHDRGIYIFGLGLAAFAIIYIFSQIKQGFDANDRARQAGTTASTIKTAEHGLIGRVTQ